MAAATLCPRPLRGRHSEPPGVPAPQLGKGAIATAAPARRVRVPCRRASQRALGAVARLQAVAQHARELGVGARGRAARRISSKAVEERLAGRQQGESAVYRQPSLSGVLHTIQLPSCSRA